ncbi:hypothetical protein [Bordetella sp. BOR01]|uniref:hypothetical protein n=1 Tax=Bordetella sp. BOR01 TaxID=2854779 RepID=UPI001C44B1C7|nr:hypothetical protein [Bordetella sp. BOR01]MBV7486803.1 hypothetical protein [Bordetella sp. BOR01]
METELDGRLLALRQTVALALALSTRSNPQATELALDILADMKASVERKPADSPFETPPWATAAQEELDGIARLVRSFTQQPDDASGQ